MSHIAAALAKSKGRKVEAPPPGTPVAPELTRPVLPMPARASSPAAQPTVKKKFPLALVLGGGGTVIILGTVGWFLLKPAAAPSAKPAATAPQPAAPAPKPTASPPTTTPAPVAAVLGPTPTPTQTLLPPTPEIAALQEQVAKFSVSARMSGANQRAMINGKVYVVGDHVTDSLTLQEVLSDRVVLRDDNGNLYSK